MAKLPVLVLTTCAGLLTSGVALPANYYVSPAGSDSNPGNFTQPFRNIQKAASVLAPGDTCFIRAGVYRETVRPAQSGTQSAPITFVPFNSETVTISGADVLSGPWTPLSGNIYRTSMPVNLGDGNQVFADGQMLIEARWPNTSLDIVHPTVASSASGSFNGAASGGLSNGSISDPQLPNRPPGYWNGATLHIRLGRGWGWQTATVVDSSTPGVLSFTYRRSSPPYLDPSAKNPYFLTGIANELDAPGEWFRDSNGVLSLWTPDGASPTQHLIEFKSRLLALDLTSRSFIRVSGLNLFAATINTDMQSRSLLLEGLNVRYVSHFSQPSSPYAANNSGIVLNGSGHILRDSTIALSAGDGVAVYGAGHLIHNVDVSGIGYAGTYASGVSFYSGGSTAAYNSLHDAGRFGVLHSGVGAVRILHNEVFNYGLQTSDLGCTYAYQTDAQQSEIAYNRCHDTLASTGAGVYLDNGTSNAIVHHNVTWNVSNALIVLPVAANNKIYNNTFLGLVTGLDSAPLTAPQTPGTEFKNNIFSSPAANPVDAIFQANLVGTDPGFVDAANHNYQLQPGSPAISAGAVLPPFTDGYTGARPDVGAYDHGLPRWTAGSGQTPLPISLLANYAPALAPGCLAFAAGPVAASGSLANLTLQLTDSSGVHWNVPALTAGPTGSAFVIPKGVVPGPLLVAVNRADGLTFLGSASVYPVAPGLFSADSSGAGLAAAYVVRVKADGSQHYELTSSYDASGNLHAIPIDLGPPSDQVYVVFGGTGIQGASSLANVSFNLGGLTLPAAGISSSATYLGLDYAGVLLPRSLQGAGSAPVRLTVDGQASNTVTIPIQ